jgi:hypothetical protein
MLCLMDPHVETIMLWYIYMSFALMDYTRSDLPLPLEAQRVSIRLATLHHMIKEQLKYLHVRIKILLSLQSYASKYDILIYGLNVNIQPQPKNQCKTCLIFRAFSVVNHYINYHKFYVSVTIYTHYKSLNMWKTLYYFSYQFHFWATTDLRKFLSPVCLHVTMSETLSCHCHSSQQ